MKFAKLALILAFFAVASCEKHDDFTGKWKEISNTPSNQTFLEIRDNGTNDLLKTIHRSTTVGDQMVSATHTEIATPKDGTLQFANGLIIITIDKGTGHLIFPRADGAWEFERGK